MNTASSILQAISGHTVLVVGDVMIDRYLTGSVNRISPEAPVPVVLQTGSEDRLGGAANVALNIKALGSTPILCSVIGQDAEGQQFRSLLPASALADIGLALSNSRRTTVKTRILGNNQQMLRVDAEDTHDLSEQETEAFLKKIRQLLREYPISAVILQDYNKGVLSEYVIREAVNMAKETGAIVTVDPKKKNFFAFEAVDLFKPNLKEVRDSVPFPVSTDIDSLNAANAYLQKTLKNRMTMITLSEKGLYLNVDSVGAVFPTTPRKVADVSGAGDSVISVATLAMAGGVGAKEVAILSNLAGGQVCEFPGVVPVSSVLLEAELEAYLKDY